MSDIPEWAVRRAVEMANQTAGYTVQNSHQARLDTLGPYGKSLARYIAEHEEPPVDPLLIEAREIAATNFELAGAGFPEEVRAGAWDHKTCVIVALAALKRGIEIGKGQP